MTSELWLPFDDDHVPDSQFPIPRSEPLHDRAARAAAVDPAQNVVLEASAGTGKTWVLVERYVNLLRAGVDPENILAITFTRKAAAEMRQRIIDRLREAARLSELDRARWRDLKARLGDIAISTIDAFCLSLLREFPLEADVDPGFELASDTDVPRLIEESLDRAFRLCRAVAAEDDDVALLFAQLGERRLRSGIAALVDRRLIAPRVLGRYLAVGPKDLSAAVACRRAAARLREIFLSIPAGPTVRARHGPQNDAGLRAFLNDGPHHRAPFAMLAADIVSLVTVPSPGGQTGDGGEDEAGSFHSREEQAAFRAFIDRLRAYFLKQDGDPRGKNFAGTGFGAIDCHTEDAWKRHRQTAAAIAPPVAEAIRGLRRDLNVVMSRGVWRIFSIALRQYERALESHALLDFPGVLERAVKLLKDLDEFAESRLRLEARHRHVLLDEFQDTSRAQWELVRQLVRTWGEGMGAADDAIAPSIFIVGDRKQSIYGFRDADVALVDDAAAFIEGLRPDCRPRQAITVSFRSAPEILSFVNDVCAAMLSPGGATLRRDAFRYDERDRFPVAPPASPDPLDRPDSIERSGSLDRLDAPVVSLVVGDSVSQAADRVADEIVGLLSGSQVRDRVTGARRDARPADVAILFRSRDSHREFEAALARRGVPTYVYKGLGFFDSDEVQDAVALLRYLADPLSDLRAASLLRSRLVRLSDAGVATLSPRAAGAILDPKRPDNAGDPTRQERGFLGLSLDAEDRRVLDLLRASVPQWLARVDRQTPSDLMDSIFRETTYAYELGGTRRRQARENLKKFRSMIRRAQNRGYATLSRLADYVERLAVGDESNAAIDALDAVSLMTVHAAKGLEFPIVFVVNMGRGTGGIRPPIRIACQANGDASVAIADYQSEADEDASAREREETKRLLYVALTRARNRLYLSATVQDGRCRAGRGSLAEVLPDDLKNLLAAAANDDQVFWMGPSGARHVIGTSRWTGEPRRFAQPHTITPIADDFEVLE